MAENIGHRKKLESGNKKMKVPTIPVKKIVLLVAKCCEKNYKYEMLCGQFFQPNLPENFAKGRQPEWREKSAVV
jgi:hypothetical protein